MKRSIAAIVALTALLSAGAQAQSVSGVACQEQFRHLPALAARLHVRPTEPKGGLSFRMCAGRVYDMIELVNALLDRMAKASK